MIKYVVFTQEELDAIKNGHSIKSIDGDHLVVYINEEKYTEMLMSMKEKEIDDDSWTKKPDYSSYETYEEFLKALKNAWEADE